MVSKSSSTGGNKPSNNSVNTNNMVRIKAMNNPNINKQINIEAKKQENPKKKDYQEPN